MEIGQTLFLMDQIGIIQKEMEKLGKTDWILNQEDDRALASIYFLNSSTSINDNNKVLAAVKKLEKKFDLKSFSIGKTVTFYLETKK